MSVVLDEFNRRLMNDSLPAYQRERGHPAGVFEFQADSIKVTEQDARDGPGRHAFVY